ncbi:MAG TPA: DHA2 family efflux MFS transporter permease subunit [Acidimicrobiia bacterium]
MTTSLAPHQPGHPSGTPIEADAGPDPRRWLILAVLCTSLATVMIANASLNNALPSMAEHLHATTSALQWIVDAYSLMFAGLLFAAGSLGDRFGRKGALQLGLFVFVAGAVAGALSSTAAEVIVSRGVMGLGAAFVMPATLSIIVNVFPTEERARAIAIWTAVAGAGGALGPLASGVLLEHFSWNSVFLVNVPVVVVALVAGLRIVPTSRDVNATRVDVLGALLSIAGISTLVYAIIEAPDHGWLSMETALAFAMAATLLATFTWWELRTATPMLNLRWFRHRAFSVGSAGMMLSFFALYGMMFLLTQYLQLVHDYSPLAAAVRLLPIVAVMIFVSPIAPRLVARFGANRVVGTGLAVLAVGAVLLSRVTVSSAYLVLAAAMMVMVAGMAVSMAPLTNAIMSGVPRDRAGVGSAMNDTSRELGGALGVAVLGSILTSQYAGSIAPSIAGLPASARAAANTSLAGALQVAARLDPVHGSVVANAARHAYVQGMGAAFLVGALVIGVAAAIAARLMPANVEDADHAPVIADVELLEGVDPIDTPELLSA